MQGFMASGNVYGAVYKGTELGPLLYLGNAKKFFLKANGEQKEDTSNGRDDYGQVETSVIIGGKTEFSMELKKLNHKNQAILLMGFSEPVNITGASPTGETHKAFKGGLIQLDNRQISAVTSGALVLDTDFEIFNARSGLIKILDAWAGSEGDELTFDYTHANMTANKVVGATKPGIRMYLYLDGYDLVQEMDTEVKVWEVLLMPEDGIDYLSSDLATLPLSGVAIKPADKRSPFEVLTDIATT